MLLLSSHSGSTPQNDTGLDPVQRFKSFHSALEAFMQNPNIGVWWGGCCDTGKCRCQKTQLNMHEKAIGQRTEDFP